MVNSTAKTRPPNVIVGGAPKSGTSALYRYFEQHPQICLSKKKELHYFSRPFLEKHCEGPGDRFIVAEIPETFEEYLSNFSHCDDADVIADISPSYLHFPQCAEEMKRLLGEVRLIFILRNPVEKAFSQYVHLLGTGRESLPFEAALECEEERKKAGYSDMWLYRSSGYYADAIESFFRIFGKQNVAVILYEEFCNEQELVLKEICNFMNVDSSFGFQPATGINRSGIPKSSVVANLIAPNWFTYLIRRMIPQRAGRFFRNIIKNWNTGEKPVLHKDTEAMLRAAFESDINKLEQLLGKKTGWADVK